MEEKIC